MFAITCLKVRRKRKRTKENFENFVCFFFSLVFWSRKTIIPLILNRFQKALSNAVENNAVEIITMCEFLGELLNFHYFSAPHILTEIVDIFEQINENILSEKTVFPQEFLELFFFFFPKNIPLMEPALQLTVCTLADQDDWVREREIYEQRESE